MYYISVVTVIVIIIVINFIKYIVFNVKISNAGGRTTSTRTYVVFDNNGAPYGAIGVTRTTIVSAISNIGKN